MVTPIIIPTPSGGWGIGPSLLYLIGVIAICLYHTDWKAVWRAMWRDNRSESEKRKDEAFTRALIRDAESRRRP